MNQVDVKSTLDAIRDKAFQDLAMGKDSQLVVLKVMLDTTRTCLQAYGVEPLPNPTQKGGE